MPDGTSYYEAFPFMFPKAEGLSFAAMRPLRVLVDKWDRAGESIAAGTLEDLSGLPRQAHLQLKAEKLVPGRRKYYY